MIISKLKTNLNGVILNCQQIIVECDLCKSQQSGKLCDLSQSCENIFKKWICRACKSKLPARIEYFGSEILTELKRNKRGLLVAKQRIDVKCSSCDKVINTSYYSHKGYMLKKPKGYSYECHHCIISKKTSLRNKAMLGKTFEELYGTERAKQMRQHRSNLSKNPFIYQKMVEFNKNRIGKTYIETYGRDRAEEIYKAFKKGRKKVIPKPRYGKDNPQFGKPATESSGRGWKGYYKDNFFRSIMELSFIVNFLNANNIVWESGEQKKTYYSIHFN